MPAKRAERVLAVILAVSGVLLLLSLFGVLRSPWPGGAVLPETTGVTAALPPPNGSAETDMAGSAETGGSQTDKGLLPLTGNDPSDLSPGGTSLRQWPQTSAVPVLRDVQRSAFNGRDYDAQALSGITVILDAGHGGSDEGQGAFGAADAAPLHEKTVNLKAAQLAGEKLKALGANVIYTRTDDTDRSLFYRVAFAADYVLLKYEEEGSLAGYNIEPIRHLRPLMADVMRINQGSADSGGRGIFGSIGTEPDLRLIYDIEAQYGDVLLISLQTGFSSDETLRGVRSVYMSNPYIQSANNGYAAGLQADTLAPNYTAYNSDDRFRLAGLLQAHISAEVPGLATTNEAVREEDMAVLRLTNLNSAVVELGMLSNAEDRALLTDDATLGSIATAIANAVYQYYCLP